MRVRLASTSVGISAALLLTLPACSTESSQDRSTPRTSVGTGKPADAGRDSTPLPSDALKKRLLNAHDLGAGYTLKPESPARRDDVTVLGCPALNSLGGEAATGGSLDLPRKAKTTLVYNGGSSSEISEELYSDTADKLSRGTSRVFHAMTSCPEYQVLAGNSAIDIATQRVGAPELGNERWSQLMTFTAGGRSTVVKQTAIRDRSVLLVLSGSPALVDRHIETALAKATAAR